jgi:hypothetical protein
LLGISDLVEDGNIAGLDFFFEGLDGFLEVVNGDLFIFNDTANNKLVNSVGNGFLLVILFPDEAVHLNSENLLEKSVEIGFSFVWLDVEKDE